MESEVIVPMVKKIERQMMSSGSSSSKIGSGAPSLVMGIAGGSGSGDFKPY
jgi:hypothetical protein